MKTKILVFAVALLAFASCKKEDPCIDKNKIDTKIMCNERYKPICGCDGNTYSNICIAENYYGIKSWTEGPCKTTQGDGCIDPNKIDPTLLCPENIDFVCGCDGVTYNNVCNAERNGVLNWSKGKCEVDTTDMACIEVCEDSCVTLRAPRTITLQVEPKISYKYVWRPASNSGANSSTYTLCPSQNTTVYLELWLTQCGTPIKSNGWCGTTSYGNGESQEGSGIMLGGCYETGCTTRLQKVIKYCVEVKDCEVTN